MAFKKAFPKTTDKSVYPRWSEIELTAEEEKEQEELARKANIVLMKDCLDDAKHIFKEKELKKYQSDIVNMAISLFEKRASHQVYWKERKAKQKFDEQ